ncbi:MAG: NAD(P)H-binding protein [Actinophytocola sp.]|uniref:NAD(P)-dependent oxidoreductase n=1 Tax=Actinophytocola sp. TaxID=1872138 RepID=UPI001322CAD1|nr:NAD(P)H-binding protein [Actinophytocola sp.]MPZ79855.1 NAD(P)H-binding protein [Actinophytocola sp.]
MSKIVVFGAGGRAGRRIVTHALARGHEVTAVVRDPGRHPALTTERGDVTDPDDVATLSAGHDVAVNAAARLDMSSTGFYTAATRTLIAGLATPRLIAIGIGTVLADASGTPLYEAPDFPAGAREFTLGHVAELELLKASALDWVVLAPPPTTLDPDAPGMGRYRFGDTHALPAAPFSYADLAAAVVEEIEQSHHHRALVAVGPA